MQKWEYKFVTQEWIEETGTLRWTDTGNSDSDSKGLINNLGQEGWELVSVAVLGSGIVLIYYFKRPLQE
jgi:hypothetical protein